jgi:hypothetical protein
MMMGGGPQPRVPDPTPVWPGRKTPSDQANDAVP